MSAPKGESNFGLESDWLLVRWLTLVLASPVPAAAFVRLHRALRIRPVPACIHQQHTSGVSQIQRETAAAERARASPPAEWLTLATGAARAGGCLDI